MKINIGTCGSDAERAKRINEKLRQDGLKEAEVTGDAHNIIKEELEQHLGYSADDIEENKVYNISSGDHSAPCNADFIVSIDGRPFMAFKCTMAIDARQRHVLAMARSMGEQQTPMYAVVSDGLEARVFDTITGKLVSSAIEELPTRTQAMELLSKTQSLPYPPEKLKKERQILLAFETTLCPPTGRQ